MSRRQSGRKKTNLDGVVLTPEQGELAANHYFQTLRMARRSIPEPLRRNPWITEIAHDVAVERLMELAIQHDPTRGVDFWGRAKKHIYWRVNDSIRYAVRERKILQSLPFRVVDPDVSLDHTDAVDFALTFVGSPAAASMTRKHCIEDRPLMKLAEDAGLSRPAGVIERRKAFAEVREAIRLYPRLMESLS